MAAKGGKIHKKLTNNLAEVNEEILDQKIGLDNDENEDDGIIMNGRYSIGVGNNANRRLSRNRRLSGGRRLSGIGDQTDQADQAKIAEMYRTIIQLSSENVSYRLYHLKFS